MQACQPRLTLRSRPLFALLVLVLGFALLLTTSAQAQNTIQSHSGQTDPEPDRVIVLTDEQGEYPLGLYLAILEDKDKIWTIEDVTSPELAGQFTPSQEEAPGFGFTNSAYWIRFQVLNGVDETIPWLLLVDSYLFYIDVYQPAAEVSGYDVTQTGTARPYDTRATDHPKFLFDLSILPGEEQTIYARFESESAMNLSLAIWSANAVAQDDLITQMLNGFLYGVLLIMATYNFILFVTLRDRSYLYYVLFLSTLLLAYLTSDGVAHKYIWPGQGRINAIGGQLFFTLLLIFTLLFTNSFLRLKRYAPRLQKGVIVVIGVLCLMLPLQWLSLLWTARPVALLTIVTFVIVVSSGILVWRKGYQPARYFLLAWLLLLLSFMLFVLSLFGIAPPSLFSIAGTQIGIVVMVLTLSLALVDRINIFRQEKETAQLEVMRQQQETIQLKDEFARTLKETNEALEMRMQERLQELSFAQVQLNTLFERSPLGIGFADEDGDILSANTAMAQIFGYTVEEFLQRNVTDFFPTPELRAEVMHRLETEETIQLTPIELRRKDGSLFHATLTESKLEVGEQVVLLGVVNDITDRIEAEEVQKTAAEQAAVAEERNRIAHELHDSVTQALYTTSLIAEALPAVWQSHPDQALQSLDELRSLTQGSLAEMRTLLLELRPGELADRELSVLLHQLTDAMSARTDLPITTTIIGSCVLPTDVQIAFYRIAQEALNNVVKHANASRTHVSLQCHPDGTILRVQDNGRGFDQGSEQPHQLGLSIMRERAQKIGATLTIDSQPEHGTEIIAKWHPPELT